MLLITSGKVIENSLTQQQSHKEYTWGEIKHFIQMPLLRVYVWYSFGISDVSIELNKSLVIGL